MACNGRNAVTESELDGLVRIAEAAADIARAAILPLFRQTLAADLKSDASPVTIADRTAELAMRAVLAERCPAHGVHGEEFGLQNPDARLRWVLDPIDGTRAFITGRPQFGTLIALLDGDTPILGIIDQPALAERWVGVAGRATQFRSRIGGSVGCRPCATLAEAELSCTSPDVFIDPVDHTGWNALRGKVRRTSFGGDCYAYGLLALGHIDVIAEASMKVWDWAALVPVIAGAGGVLCDWHGGALHPDGDGRVLAVGDARLLPAVMNVLAA